MGPHEVAEMRHHLAFIRTHRAVLRLQLNAAEDLLVNGQRDPEDRGVCRHLLDKVDRSCIDSALAREPVKSDPKARATLLAGAVALSRDVGILITYLETLTQLTSRADQARAFVEAVGRIDFEALSAARLSRLLQLLLDIFDGTSRTQVLLGLLEQSVFRRAVDLAFSQLGEEVQDALRPLRILGQLVFREGVARTADEQAAVRSALDAVMALPAATLKGLSVPVRTGLLDVAVNLTGAPALLDRVMDGLLPELPKDGRDHSRITTRYAAQLLARQDDVRAKNVLELVVKAHPDFRQPARWLAELQLPRVGRVAVKDATPRAGLTRGFFLDAQEEVWLRTTPLANAAALNDEARLQVACGLPGVARVVATFSHGDVACCAVTAAGQPLNLGSLPKMDTERRVVLGQMLRVVNALALAGLTLPDVRCERWLFHAQPAVVTLADVSGLQARGADAVTSLTDAARALFQQVLPAALVPPDADLAALVQAAESTAQSQ